MGEKVETIDATDFRRRHLVRREAAGLPIKGELQFKPLQNPIAKELEDANRVRR